MLTNVLTKFRSDLEKSMEKGLNCLDFDKLVKNIEAGNLFVMASESAVIVFEKKFFGNKRVVNTVLCGGDLNEVSSLQKELEVDAEKNGADGVMIIGRKGWGKVFDGYKDVATVYFKEFTK